MKNEQIKNQNGKMKYRTRENNRNSALAIKLSTVSSSYSSLNSKCKHIIFLWRMNDFNAINRNSYSKKKLKSVQM